jgi:hypothetical protein
MRLDQQQCVVVIQDVNHVSGVQSIIVELARFHIFLMDHIAEVVALVDTQMSLLEHV